jgi:hypothetical protein
MLPSERLQEAVPMRRIALVTAGLAREVAGGARI